jgi:hypothetical protein
MKTDKLLHLLQQKKFMRSGGALPLPKAQTGIPSVAAANQQTIQNAGNPYLNRAMVQAVLAKANQPVTNTLGRVISTPASREQERREKVVANDPSQYSVMPGFQSDYNLGIQEPGADNSVLSDPIAMAAAATAGGIGLGAYGLTQIPRMFLGNLASEATAGLTDVGKYLTRNTALKNAYKEVPKPTVSSSVDDVPENLMIEARGLFAKEPMLGKKDFWTDAELQNIIKNKKLQDELYEEYEKLGPTQSPKDLNETYPWMKEKWDKLFTNAPKFADKFLTPEQEKYIRNIMPSFEHGLDSRNILSKKELYEFAQGIPKEPLSKKHIDLLKALNIDFNNPFFQGYIKEGLGNIKEFSPTKRPSSLFQFETGKMNKYGGSVNPEGLTEQDFKNYYEQDLERKGNPGYNLIIKKNGGSSKNIVVSDLWKQVTGSDWSQAKKLGLTDGSYEQNIALRENLISSLNNQPAEKPQLNIPPKAKPRVAPSIQRVAVNPMAQDASAVRPSNQQLAYEYYKTQPFGLTDPYSNVPLDQQYAMMQSATRQDQVYQTPTGLRAGIQGVLNQINQATNNDLAGAVSNFITYPVQAGVNIANTVAGDTPIRSDDDVINLAMDAAAVLPYARGLKNLTGKGIRSAAYRGIEPFDYGIVDKTKNFFPNLIGNTLDPSRQLRNITEKYKSTGVSAKKAERLGKNMLDSWATGLGIPQKYNTLKKVGDDTYRIANSKIQADRLKNIWKEVNRYKRNSPNQQLITHASKDPKFSHSVYDFDSENALMGQYRWDVKKLSDGNIHFKSFDKYDLHPFGKRGAIFAKPESWVDEWRSKYFNKNLQDFEALSAIGGKPYNVENNFIFNPKTNKIVKRFNEGGVTYKVKIKKSK